MGRYYYYVHATTLDFLTRTRPDLDEAARDRRAHEFAAAYARSRLCQRRDDRGSDRERGHRLWSRRRGWVQVPGASGLERLNASTRMAEERGFRDWVKIPSGGVFDRAGLKTDRPAGFSIGAATWHPAKWVWGLMRIALSSPSVRLYTRTKVLRVEDEGDYYAVHTLRGIVRTRYLINATESHTPLLFPDFHDKIIPMQTQAAWGASDGGTMKANVGISSDRAFFGRHGKGIAVRFRCDPRARSRSGPQSTLALYYPIFVDRNEAAVQRSARRGGP